MIGNGIGLSITHTGSTIIPKPSQPCKLTNVLCVLAIKTNLISISKFYLFNNVSIEFLPFLIFCEGSSHGPHLLQGPIKNGVYEWATQVSSSPPLIAFSSVKASIFEWHNYLGHPFVKVLWQLISSRDVSVSSTTSSTFSYNACKCNKNANFFSHKLLFSILAISSSSSLEVIYYDVWGLPIKLRDGYKYYVIFVDHFTKYIWLYPLKWKSEVYDVFGSL